MHWTRGIAVALVATAAGAAAPASAQTGTGGELGAGGTAFGDVSLDAGDEDAIGVDLVAGSTFDVKFAAAFGAELTCAEADGDPVAFSLVGTKTRTAKAVAVRETGRHVFRVRSTDGRQGTYTLSVTPKWPTRGAVRGTSGTPALLPLPAGGVLAGKVAADRAAGVWDPQIAALAGPDGGALLAAPVAGKNGTAKLGPVTATSAGLHALTVDGGAPGAPFTATFTVRAPRVKPTKLDLRNGLTVVSFASGGVRDLLQTRCGACHVWTGSAAAFKPRAKTSLRYVSEGSMPQDGTRLSADEIALLTKWIDTGMKP